jgi:hypothetical protein
VNSENITAADLRIAHAARVPRIPLYVVAARARLHPATLSSFLNERRQVSPAVARRILMAIQRSEPKA